MDHLPLFAATFAALYAGHHVGDYWVQSDHQARHKGDVGIEGILQCTLHCVTLVITQTVCLLLLVPIGARFGWWQTAAGLWLSLVSHYAADRREHGLMFKLARLLPGKAKFLELGRPRALSVPAGQGEDGPVGWMPLDNPSLGTGAWALDQAWHIFFGVFLAAVVIAL